MALTYVVASPPKTYFSDLFGRPASGGQLFTRSNINPTLNKPVYLDQFGPDGAGAWSNPIIIDATGSQGPFYWEVNDTVLDDTYYLEFYDEDDNLIWTVTDFVPNTGDGGGGTAATRVVQNMLVNNVFWQNNFTNSALTIPSGSGVTISSTSKLAPGAHAAMYHPDIFAYKSSSTGTETIRFFNFNNGENFFSPDNTPEQYCEYTCTVSSGASPNGIFIPITTHLKTLENQSVTVSIYARRAVASGDSEIELLWYQFPGTGGTPSGPQTPTISSPFNLDETWRQYKFPVTVPLASNIAVQGSNGNAELLLYIRLPANPARIWLAKPAIYLGNSVPTADFQSYDEIDSVINAPRTGDIRVSMNNFTPFGWVRMNDTTIGRTGSAATQRANNDTFYLYKLLWENVSDTFAPVSGGRGATADADFAAGKTLQLLYSLGAVLGNTGVASATVYGNGSGHSWALGEADGGERSLFDHTHGPLAPNTNFIMQGAGGGTLPVGVQAAFAATTASAGNTAANTFNNVTIPPTLRTRFFIKL